MHQYCNVLSFLVSRQKLGPDGRSEWLWAAPTGAHSQPAACVQRGQVPQAARARAPPTCAHGRTALPAQAGRHRPRYQLRDPPCTSSLASTPWLAWGLGRGENRRARSSPPSCRQMGLSGHHTSYSFTASVPASEKLESVSTSLGPHIPPGVLVFPDPTSLLPAIISQVA